jgi:DNA-binding MurR/RpiR family transcriptional regulator
MYENIDAISRINQKFNSMSKSHKKIAAFVLEQYENAAFMTAAKLAKAVNVSEATVVRFAYALGYEGYP